MSASKMSTKDLAKEISLVGITTKNLKYVKNSDMEAARQMETTSKLNRHALNNAYSPEEDEVFN